LKISQAAAKQTRTDEKYLETVELTAKRSQGPLGRRADRRVTPVTSSTAAQNIGVASLLDTIVHYLPSADLAKAPNAKSVKTGADVVVKQGKFAAQVIKTTFDHTASNRSSSLSGTLDITVPLYTNKRRKGEKPTQPAMMRGKKTKPMERQFAGDIGVVPKLQYTATDNAQRSGHPIVFDEIEFRNPDFPRGHRKETGRGHKSSPASTASRRRPTIRMRRMPETVTS
jgi:elongation factor G